MPLQAWSLCLALMGAGMGAASAVRAATLYTCVDARGIVRYSGEPCVQGQPPMAIDRIEPDERAVPPRPQGAGALAPGGVRADDRAAAGRVLTPEQNRRIAQLRKAEQGMTREAQIATEIEIAAMREGVDDVLATEDRAAIDALRADLAAADPRTRQHALQAWRAIYAQYRIAPRPSASPGERIVRPSREIDIQAPLGRPAPGMQGPLVAAPPAPPSLAPAGRPPLVADPATGRVLAPFGDRLVDPLTGTLWQRAGSVYVDPATGRVIPAP